MSTDSLFRIFSMTPADGTTVAMQMLERGKITLEPPVKDILPLFAELQALEGFGGHTPDW